MTHHQEREGRRGREKRQPHRFVFVVERLEERCLPASLAPAATTQAATNVASTAATLNGSVNPNGSSTDTFFQYSTDPSLPANVVTTLAGTAGQIGSADGTGSRPVLRSVRGSGGQLGQHLRGGHEQRHDPRRSRRPGWSPRWRARQATSAAPTAPARRPVLRIPWGVAVDGAGNVYVANTTPTPTTRSARSHRPGWSPPWRGQGRVGSADGTGTPPGSTLRPGVAVDGAGNVYVADTQNGTIRKLSIPSIPAQSGLTGTNRRGGERDPDRPRARHDLFLPGRGNQRQGHDCR